MKIYCGKNSKGVWIASLDAAKMKNCNDAFESEIETVCDNKVYMIQIYYGFTFNLGLTGNPICNAVSYVPQAYHSVLAAKEDDIWKAKENLAKKDPENFHITELSIASDDYGKPFTFGASIQDKFNMKIFSVKVI